MPPTPIPTPILVQVSDSGSSFLDSPLLVGILTLAGVALGAWLNHVFNRRHEDRKAARETAQRWDSNLLDHTASVIALSKRLRSAAADYRTVEDAMTAVGLDQMNRGATITPPAGHMAAINELESAFDDLARECNLLELLAPPLVREATRQVWDCAAAVMRSDGSGFEVSHALTEAVDALGEAVRAHLRIPNK